MLKKHAIEIAHTLSKPSKMPGKAYGLPAAECKTGSKLRAIPGSTCSSCYACKGCYGWESTQSAQYKRLAAIYDPRWSDAMVTLISTEAYFRWHDSGDLMSYLHLLKIVDICERTPNTRHWLPTREAQYIKQYQREYGAFPENLVVRVSAAMIDGKAQSIEGVNTSSVHAEKPAQGYACPAYKQNGKCGLCRACWTKEIDNVSYPKH